MKVEPVQITGDEFEKFFEERVQKCREVLVLKAREYSSNDDKMRNFNVAGRMLDMPSYKVAFLYMMKHFESLYDIILNDKKVSPEMWDEKVGDMLNYLFLIDAMWRKASAGACGQGDGADQEGGQTSFP